MNSPEPEFPPDALPGALDHPNPMNESEKDTHVDDETVVPMSDDPNEKLDLTPEYPDMGEPVVESQDEGAPDEMGPPPEDLPS